MWMLVYNPMKTIVLYVNLPENSKGEMKLCAPTERERTGAPSCGDVYDIIWLVVYLPLWKMLVNWDDNSQYMEKKKCSKPPTSIMVDQSPKMTRPDSWKLAPLGQGLESSVHPVAAEFFGGFVRRNRLGYTTRVCKLENHGWLSCFVGKSR